MSWRHLLVCGRASFSSSSPCTPPALEIAPRAAQKSPPLPSAAFDPGWRLSAGLRRDACRCRGSRFGQEGPASRPQRAVWSSITKGDGEAGWEHTFASNAVHEQVRNRHEHVECGGLRRSLGARGWIGVAAAAILVTVPCAAHHSFAMFDQSRSVILHGVVRDFRWTNPHVFIQRLTTGDAGSQSEWSIEMTSPEHLSRFGWRPGTLKPGDKERVM